MICKTYLCRKYNAKFRINNYFGVIFYAKRDIGAENQQKFVTLRRL